MNNLYAIKSEFWSNVSIRGVEDCWVWNSRKKTRDGYGIFFAVINNQKCYRANRAAYMLSKGAIPAGKLVMHTCDNPPCCNPNHLKLGTDKDNAEDRNNKGRTSKGYKHSQIMKLKAARGETHGTRLHPESHFRGEDCVRAKVTEDEVRQMRRMKAEGKYTYKQLAKIYGIAARTVQCICLRTRWSHVK